MGAEENQLVSGTHQLIFAEGELVAEQVVRKFGISEFSTKPTNLYNRSAADNDVTTCRNSRQVYKEESTHGED